jgi:hypothetical protein
MGMIPSPKLFCMFILSLACFSPNSWAQNRTGAEVRETASGSARTREVGPAGRASSATPPGDCCSAEAMKKIAASLGYLDVVGIKLGMTPQQAVAAIKAHNANLKIDVVHARLEHPTATPGTFEKVPLWIFAHSPQQGYGAENIGLEFTTPPNPPLVAKVGRYVSFPNGQPVLQTTLVDALDKKYGAENSADGQLRLWVYDTAGKPVNRFLTRPEGVCNPGNISLDFPTGDIRGMDPGNDGILNLSRATMDEGQILYDRHAACAPLTFVAAKLSAQTEAPNSPVGYLIVVLSSPALLRNSQQSTHDWLQAELDAKLKQEKDAAAKRAAPKM